MDHINPKSWLGNVRVGDVDIKKEYLAGRDDANALLVKEFGPDKLGADTWAPLDFDDLFALPKIDHLRPAGEYIGCRPIDLAEQQEWDNDNDGVLEGALIAEAEVQLAAEQELRLCTQPEITSDTALDVLSQDEEEEEGGNTEDTNFSEDMDGRDNVDLDIESETEDDPLTSSDPGYNTLNPSPPTTESHHLIISSVKRHKLAVFSEVFGAQDNGRMVNNRPKRAAGLTIENSLRFRHLNIGDENEDNDKVKAGDLGAVLMCIEKDICMVVVEILSFKQGSIKKRLFSIPYDNLEAVGSNSITIAIQVLHLESKPVSASADWVPEASWTWPNCYVQLHMHKKSEVASQKHFTMHISGKVFHALSPEVIYNAKQKPIWSLTHADLKSVFDDAWSSMDPETDEILQWLQQLPKLKKPGPGLPYKYFGDPSFQFSVRNPSYPPESPSNKLIQMDGLDPNEKVTGATSILCRLCGTKQRLSAMRTHIGKHIFRSHYDITDRLLDDIHISCSEIRTPNYHTD